MDQVIILERGDAWLSRDSLEDIAVFSGEDEFERFVDDMLKKDIIDDYGHKCLTGYYGEHQRQCEIVRTGQMLNIRIEDLNPPLEDTDLV